MVLRNVFQYNVLPINWYETSTHYIPEDGFVVNNLVTEFMLSNHANFFVAGF